MVSYKFIRREAVASDGPSCCKVFLRGRLLRRLTLGLKIDK